MIDLPKSMFSSSRRRNIKNVSYRNPHCHFNNSNKTALQTELTHVFLCAVFLLLHPCRSVGAGRLQRLVVDKVGGAHPSLPDNMRGCAGLAVWQLRLFAPEGRENPVEWCWWSYMKGISGVLPNRPAAGRAASGPLHPPAANPRFRAPCAAAYC